MKVLSMPRKNSSTFKKESKFKEHMPDVYLVKAEQLIVYDNFNNSISVIFNANPNNISYEDALKIIYDRNKFR